MEESWGGKGESSAPEMNPKQSERVSLTPTARHLEVKRGPSFRREGLRVHQIRGSILPSLYQTGEGFFLGFEFSPQANQQNVKSR